MELSGEQEVVIVEDERELAELYADTLRQEYAVETAYDGEQALSVIDETTDVVVLDRRLPGRHGDAVLETLRTQGLDCRVLMVTAVDPGLDIVGMSFEAYLTKPVGADELLEAVNEQFLYRTYDDKLREYTRVRSQIELLQDEYPDWQLRDDDRFEQLCATADSIKADIEELLAGHDTAVDLEDTIEY